MTSLPAIVSQAKMIHFVMLESGCATNPHPDGKSVAHANVSIINV